MRPTIRVTQVFQNLSAIHKAVRALTEQDVYIGIPGEETGRKQAGVSNAYLSYIHEFGAPARGIPPRPHLIPGVEDIRAEAVEILADTAARALEGNVSAVEAGLNKIGLLGQNAVRARFVNNDWPPLAESTLDYQPLQKDEDGNALTDRRGKAKRKKSRRERERVNPLIDTGQLRKAHTYVVRKKGAGLIR